MSFLNKSKSWSGLLGLDLAKKVTCKKISTIGLRKNLGIRKKDTLKIEKINIRWWP